MRNRGPGRTQHRASKAAGVARISTTVIPARPLPRTNAKGSFARFRCVGLADMLGTAQQPFLETAASGNPEDYRFAFVRSSGAVHGRSSLRHGALPNHIAARQVLDSRLRGFSGDRSSITLAIPHELQELNPMSPANAGESPCGNDGGSGSSGTASPVH